MSIIKKVIFLGAGNVATHLAIAMNKAGISINGFYSRNIKTAAILAQKYATESGNFSQIKIANTDLIIISVPDHALEGVISNIPSHNSLIVHTSGSINMDALQATGNRIGVFYPLQTFSKDKKLDYSNIPIMIESANESDAESLMNFAHQISDKVYRINSKQRQKIHIAAVFSSNFTNYLYHIAADLLKKEEIPFDVIQPLITETVDKLKDLQPFDAQTGPAVREDFETIENHLQDLKNIPEYHELYQLLSNQIIKSRNK